MISRSEPDEDLKMLRRWLREDRAAIDCVVKLFEIFHLWDDLIDGDNPRGADSINAAFIHALVRLPQNPFYARNQATLVEAIERGIVDWHTATAIEQKLPHDRHEMHRAYVLRCSVLGIITKCAELVGGLDWALEVDPEIWAYGMRETFEQYMEDFQCPQS